MEQCLEDTYITKGGLISIPLEWFAIDEKKSLKHS